MSYTYKKIELCISINNNIIYIYAIIYKFSILLNFQLQIKIQGKKDYGYEYFVYNESAYNKRKLCLVTCRHV